ncbi:proteasome subunit beta type-7-A-like protein, partial [Tanacetum coccineum]
MDNTDAINASRGTTISGVITREGVILAVDKRVTSGLVIDDTYTRKILRLSNNFYCCYCDTAGDATYCIEEASSALLLKGNNDKEPHKDDPTLVRKNRHVKKPSYAAMGSGESFALTVLSNYNANST